MGVNDVCWQLLRLFDWITAFADDDVCGNYSICLAGLLLTVMTMFVAIIVSVWPDYY